MKILWFLIATLFLFCTPAFAQIANTSFFPSMKSINPGVPHLRKQGFISADHSKTSIEKKWDIQTAQIVDGVTEEVTLEKNTVFWAGKGSGITAELIFDQEDGTRSESFEMPTFKRTTTTDGNSKSYGGILDFGFVGFTFKKASFENFYDFHVDTIPNLNRTTHDTKLDYTLTRIGTAFEIKGFSLGAFYSVRKAEGTIDSILYNPTTGAKNTPESSDLKYETVSYGVGLGYVTKSLHVEGSFENITKQKFSQTNDYLNELETPGLASRISLIGEIKFGKLALGGRVRQITGNYSDLEQLISSNMIYLNAKDSESRLETSFNFSYGSDKGWSASAYYTTSKVDTEEESPLFDNDVEYETTLTSIAYGLGISYVY